MTKAQGGIQGITYPIIADTSKTISDAYGVLAGEYTYDEEGRLVSNGAMIAYAGYQRFKQGAADANWEISVRPRWPLE